MIAFQTGHVSLEVEAVDADHAEAVGCPDANFRLITRDGPRYGFFMATGRVPGEDVRVPGWPTRKGIRATFVPSVIDEATGTRPVTGWVGLS